jgi:hypothetical protein
MNIANIYDLPEKMLTQYRDNPFPDNEARPGTNEFAKRFKQEINYQTTPYVIALEGGYGVGKTYFITRFCEYLKQERFDGDNAINTVYLNLWENDYITNPFPVIAAQIISTLNPAKELQESIKVNAIKITNNLLKFSAKVFGSVSIGDVLPNPVQDKEDIKLFNKDLRELIDSNGGKVVLVVDELDRCKPDYAVKALEALKHFFDVDGLFIILTTRIDFMNSICEAHYGHPRCEILGEGYIQKFVQARKELNPASERDYIFIIGGILNADSLPTMIFSNPARALTQDEEKRRNKQSVQSVINYLAKQFHDSGLSIRKTVDACNVIKRWIEMHTDSFWYNKVQGYPELIISEALKRLNIIDNRLEKPRVNWEYNDSPHNLDRIIEEQMQDML